jgi:hypothetical protein
VKSSALRGGLRYSEDMLISRFRGRDESPREHSREDGCRVCHHCGIKSMPTPNDLELHACLRNKFIAFRQPYERSHHHDTHWMSALVPPEKVRRELLHLRIGLCALRSANGVITAVVDIMLKFVFLISIPFSWYIFIVSFPYFPRSNNQECRSTQSPS